MINVYYRKLIDGRPVSGDKDQINLELGENGQLLNIYKSWSNLTYVQNIPIIPAKEAVEKLQLGDIVGSWNSFDDVVYINNITPGYHLYGEEGSVTEPCWFFIGKTGSGKLAVFEVYARQFANFTSSPTSGKVPLTVNFTDTSDIPPKQWLWDFGDGTNATERNPAHTYSTAGTYNVSLVAWNELGSDTMEKAAYITVRNPAPPVANFTGSPATGPAPLMVSFNDTSMNIPTIWLWDFGDGTNTTVQNPVHTYSTPGNYTVSLDVANEDGTNTITKPVYIIVTTPPPTTITTLPTTTATIPTTKPTPTKTHAPLPVWISVAGIAGAALVVRRLEKWT
ncbi:PKD domain-containing protein [Methanoregula formicica]|nr:PKD domain-containing protein [Methanoregula formicica]